MRRAGRTDRLAFGAAGFTFGLMAAFIWGPSVPAIAAALLAGPAMAAAAPVGRWMWSALETPSRHAVYTLVLTLGLVMPFAGGMVDLYLRTHTA